MIIQGLQAENLFKYSSLSISGLEGKGRILISGPNESGKTAIIEAICLGLFGHTVAHGVTKLAKVIKWGESQASVTVTFLGRNNRSYSIYRYFDSTGQSQASLSLVGEEEPIAKGVEVVNSTITALAGFGFQHYIDTLCLAQAASSSGSARDKTIKSLAGVADLDALANTLDAEILVGQDEVTARNDQLQELQEQLTVLDLQEEALGLLEKDRDESATRIATIQSDMTRWKTFAAEMQEASATIETTALRLSECNLESTLDAWQGRVKPMEQALDGLAEVCRKNQVEMEVSPSEKLRAWTNDLQKRLSSLKPIMESVDKDRYSLASWLGEIPGKDNLTMQGEIAKINEEVDLFSKRRKRNGNWAWVSLLLALMVGAVGGMLKFQPESAHSQTLLSLLQGKFPAWDASMVIYLLAVAGIFLLLAIVGLRKSLQLRGQIIGHYQQLESIKTRAEAARNTVQSIDSAANEPLARKVEILLQLQHAKWLAELVAWAESAGSALLKDKTQKKFIAKLQESLESFSKDLSSYNTDITEQLEAFHRELEQHSERFRLMEEQIAVENSRRAQDLALRSQMATVEAESKQHEHDIAVRRLAYNLLKGTCKGLSAQFNQELRRFIAKSAPLFTQGRYQHLRMDEDLNVAAFSTAKNDFVDFNEISTGVRYQLMLAVRMALAQALVARTNSAPQFVILDEPFVFFDRQRVRESLAALLRVSEQITQIWVIAQEHEQQQQEEGGLMADLHLCCTLEEDSLLVS